MLADVLKGVMFESRLSGPDFKEKKVESARENIPRANLTQRVNVIERPKELLVTSCVAFYHGPSNWDRENETRGKRKRENGYSVLSRWLPNSERENEKESVHESVSRKHTNATSHTFRFLL